MQASRVTDDRWLSGAILDAGRGGFHANLWNGLRMATGADHISQVTYDVEGHVLRARAVSWRNQPSVDVAVDLYASRLHSRDPNYPIIRLGGPKEIEIQILSQSSSNIADKEYRCLMFEAPGFVGKVSLIGRCADRTCYLNLYFSSASASASRALEVLKNHGVTLTCLTRHHEMIAEGASVAEQPSGFAELTVLSAREKQVIALLRQGRTAKEVAKALEISPATVVTYKSRIFEKLGVSNLKQLLLIDRPH